MEDKKVGAIGDQNIGTDVKAKKIDITSLHTDILNLFMTEAGEQVSAAVMMKVQMGLNGVFAKHLNPEPVKEENLTKKLIETI